MKSPSSTLHRLADVAIWDRMHRLSTGRSTADYVARGCEIPDSMLPGRLVARQDAATRDALNGLASSDAANVAPWVVKLLTEGK